MRIAVASGKGGTGKTTVAVNLAWTLGAQDAAVQLLDCDVEAPNAHLFLRPEIESREVVTVPVPTIFERSCSGCRKCAEACRFHAIAVPKKALVFPELCHGCGGCVLACPAGAIREERRPIGTVETGKAGKIGFVQGRLKVGETLSPRVIRAVKKKIRERAVAILDAAPGTSCPVVTALRDSEYVLLVAEPTPFGLNDLRLAAETVRELRLPFGVLVNRADAGDEGVRDYCREEKIPILAEIPDRREAAEAYARGKILAEELPEFRDAFERLWDRIQDEMA